MSIALRDQLIKSMIFSVLQCRESLSSITRDETREQAGREKRARTGSEKKMRPPPLSAKEEVCPKPQYS